MSCVFVLWLIVFMAHPLAMDMQREIEVAAALKQLDAANLRGAAAKVLQ